MRPSDVLYFAFGSNMNPAVLTGRRRVQPKLSVPAVIDGYTLSFRLRGVPYVEPGFAAIERSGPGDRRDVHGVVHVISSTQWAAIKLSEGIVDVATAKQGYQVLQLPCKTYDGKQLEVLALGANPRSLIGGPQYRGGGELGVTGAVRPSTRYLDIIRRGARHHKLSPEYLNFLDKLQPYEGGSMAGRLGAAALLPTFGVSVGLAAASVASRNWREYSTNASAASRSGFEAPAETGGQSEASSTAGRGLPEAMYDTAYTATDVLWAAHDWVLAPLLGKGV